MIVATPTMFLDPAPTMLLSPLLNSPMLASTAPIPPTPMSLAPIPFAPVPHSSLSPILASLTSLSPMPMSPTLASSVLPPSITSIHFDSPSSALMPEPLLVSLMGATFQLKSPKSTVSMSSILTTPILEEVALSNSTLAPDTAIVPSKKHSTSPVASAGPLEGPSATGSHPQIQHLDCPYKGTLQ